jgi:hypothetical protein
MAHALTEPSDTTNFHKAAQALSVGPRKEDLSSPYHSGIYSMSSTEFDLMIQCKKNLRKRKTHTGLKEKVLAAVLYG